MKKRKILHLITHTAVGGSQDNTFCTCALHDCARYEVHLASHPGGQWAARARSSCDVFHALPSPKGPWFLDCSRLTPQKDFSTLIRAFARFEAGRITRQYEQAIHCALSSRQESSRQP